MKSNMGNTDRLIRIILAIVFGGLYFSGTVTGTWGIVLVVLGVVFLLTALIKWCPLYVPFGISTCSTDAK